MTILTGMPCGSTRTCTPPLTVPRIAIGTGLPVAVNAAIRSGEITFGIMTTVPLPSGWPISCVRPSAGEISVAALSVTLP